MIGGLTGPKYLLLIFPIAVLEILMKKVDYDQLFEIRDLTKNCY
jgi:hypothetical protein